MMQNPTEKTAIMPNIKEEAKGTKASKPPVTRPKLVQKGESVLSNKSMYFGIPTSDEAKDHAEELHGGSSWRYKVVAYIHQPLFQKLMIGLLGLDMLLLFIELFILATYPHCSLIERDCLSCIASNSYSLEEKADAHRFLSGGEEPVCEHGYEFNGLPAGCDESKWSTVHAVEEAIFILTIMILSTFFIELTVEMIALTPGIFFRQFWFLLDYVIITVSLVLEISFHVLGDAAYETLVGVLVLVRIWRFVRIGHGSVEVTHENAEEGRSELLQYVEELENLLKAEGLALPPSQQHVHQVYKDHKAHLLEVIQERNSKGQVEEDEDGTF